MAEVKIKDLASEVLKGLTEYKDLVTDDMKAAVRKAGKSVKNDIRANAPKKTGAYSKSWTVKTTKETSDSLELTVYSPSKYQLAHLLEKGHGKWGEAVIKAIENNTNLMVLGLSASKFRAKNRKKVDN